MSGAPLPSMLFLILLTSAVPSLDGKRVRKGGGVKHTSATPPQMVAGQQLGDPRLLHGLASLPPAELAELLDEIEDGKASGPSHSLVRLVDHWCEPPFHSVARAPH